MTAEKRATFQPYGPEPAILKAVLYASLFDYPLTLEELRVNLPECRSDESDLLETFQGSALLRATVEYRQGYFFPRGSGHLVRERQRRESLSRRVLDKHRRVIKWVCALPYTRLVAVSGRAAHLNMDGPEDDIDLFVVTEKNASWAFTVTLILLTRLLGCRKMVCANFVMGENRLKIDPQDLFSANQIVHLKPVMGVSVYRRFLAANAFVFDFYPNFNGAAGSSWLDGPGPLLRFLKRVLELLLKPGPSQLLELTCHVLYSRYLLRKSSAWTTPQDVRLERDYLKLHTHSHRGKVMQRYQELLARALAEAGIVETPARPAGS